MRSIKRLPEAIQRSVRSGVVICDLTRIVEELVCNSLDSGATEVSVALDVGSYYVKVADNGSGITRDGLVLLGEQYATSKLEHLALMDAVNENFDFHGKTLCSISDVSLLEILTKAYGKPNGYRKVIKNSKCLFLGISDDRQDPGTTVTVRDIFFNQPVRRKLMQSSSKKVLDSIKSTLLRIALVHHDVSFIVLDLESMDKVLHTKPSSSPSLILSHTFGFENSATLNKLKLSDGELKLSGFISGPHDAIQPKAIQYFYINSRFIQKGPIHKLVNQLAAKFDLLTSWQLSANLQSEKRMKYALCPTFILNLRCPRSYYDIYTSEQSGTLVEFKDWRPVLAFIENGVMHLWSESNPRDASENRISCKKQNFQTPLYVHSPEKKKQCRNNDFAPALEECVPSFLDPFIEVAKVEKFQWGENLRSESDYIRPSIVGCSAGSRAMLNEDNMQHRFPYDIFSPQHVTYRHDNKTVGLSTASLGDILPAFNIGMNDVSTLGEGSVSAGCLKFHDDINTDQESSRSFLRSCSLERNLLQGKKSPSIKERFRCGNDGIELKRTRIDSHGCMEDETDLLISGNGLRFDDATAIPSSLHIEYNMHESEYFTGGSLQASFKSTYSPMTTSEIGYDEYSDDSMHKNFFDGRSGMEIDLIREFSAETASEDLISSNLKKRNRLQQSTFTNLHPEKEKGIDEYPCGNFETKFLSNSIERFQEKDWQPVTICSGECPKSYPAALSSEISAMKHECYEFDGSIQVSVTRGKKRLIRSNSAPPFYRRKQRYLDLANSSTMSAKSNFNNSYTAKEPKNSSCARVHSETRKFKCLQKSFGHEKTPPHDKPAIDCSFSTRPWLEMTCNADSMQNGLSEHDGEFINTESVECLETKETQDASDTAWKWRKCNLPSRECVNRSDNKKDPILDISSEILNRGRDCIVPKSIDRKCLQDAKVLNQLDKKFIAVVAGNTLALIDQHAADERIRLEELRHKVLTGEMRRTVYLDAEQELLLPEVGHQLLQNYAEQIQTWGWTCSIHSRDPSSFTRNLDFLQTRSTSVKLLSVPCILDTNLTDIDLLEFLQQLADTDGSSTVPPSVHRILNNKACRGAIMFGDTLLPSECSLIVDELKQTSLCFQCAHGRPTTVPLVDLEALHKTISKLGSHEPWHELYQHKVSLGRMKQRLRPSTG